MHRWRWRYNIQKVLVHNISTKI